MEPDVKKYLEDLETQALSKLEEIKLHILSSPYKDLRARVSILSLVNEELEDILLNWEDQTVSDFEFNDDLD